MHLHLAKNVMYQLLSRLITSGVGFLTTILVARYLGVSGFGDYTKIITVVSIFYLVSDFGLNAIYLQKDSKDVHFKDLFYARIGIV